MSTFIARAVRQPTTAGSASPRPKRSGGAGDVAERCGRDGSKTKALEAKGSASPIRAWRAAENAALQPEVAAAVSAATARPRHPFGGEGGSGPRRSAIERAARMRAVEQAWKDERARQAALEDD